MIKKSLILILTLFTCCFSYTQITSSGNYQFEIGFTGKSLENQSVSIYIDDELIFDNILFKEIPYNVYKFEKSIGYKDGLFELYSFRKGGIILENKKFQIKDLSKVKVAIEVKGGYYAQIINLNSGKYHYLKYDIKNGSLIYIKNLDSSSN